MMQKQDLVKLSNYITEIILNWMILCFIFLIFLLFQYSMEKEHFFENFYLNKRINNQTKSIEMLTKWD